MKKYLQKIILSLMIAISFNTTNTAMARFLPIIPRLTNCVPQSTTKELAHHVKKFISSVYIPQQRIITDPPPKWSPSKEALSTAAYVTILGAIIWYGIKHYNNSKEFPHNTMTLKAESDGFETLILNPSSLGELREFLEGQLTEHFKGAPCTIFIQRDRGKEVNFNRSVTRNRVLNKDTIDSIIEKTKQN